MPPDLFLIFLLHFLSPLNLLWPRSIVADCRVARIDLYGNLRKFAAPLSRLFIQTHDSELLLKVPETSEAQVRNLRDAFPFPR